MGLLNRLRRNSPTYVSRLGLPEMEMNRLAQYNGERSRGLVHEQNYVEQMAVLQERFDAAQRHRAGLTIDGVPIQMPQPKHPNPANVEGKGARIRHPTHVVI